MLRGRIAAALVLAVCSAAAPAADIPKGLESFDAAWTIIRDTHFDPTFNGVNWDRVRAELRPRAEAATSTAEIRAVISLMLARLGQSHFALVPSSADTSPGGDPVPAGHADPGFDLRLVGNDVLVTAVDKGRGAEAAGVRSGWRLVEVGTAHVWELLRALPESANERLRGLHAWRAMQSRLRGPSGSQVAVTFEDGAGQFVRLEIERRTEEGQPVTVGSLPTMFVRVKDAELRTPGGRRVGLISFNVWMPAVDRPFQRAVDAYRSADGMILDLRGNPGGLAAMMMGISGHFVGDVRPLGTMKMRDNELRFVVNPRAVDSQGRRVSVYGGPVAILVDAMSGSASECFAGGMQSIGRVRVFGQTTMGQALPALFDKLPNGDVLIHAYGDFVTAGGTRLEGRGVIPDEQVPFTRTDLLAGRDRSLQAALGWVDAKASAKSQ